MLGLLLAMFAFCIVNIVVGVVLFTCRVLKWRPLVCRSLSLFSQLLVSVALQFAVFTSVLLTCLGPNLVDIQLEQLVDRQKTNRQL